MLSKQRVETLLLKEMGWKTSYRHGSAQSPIPGNVPCSDFSRVRGCYERDIPFEGYKVGLTLHMGYQLLILDTVAYKKKNGDKNVETAASSSKARHDFIVEQTVKEHLARRIRFVLSFRFYIPG